MKATIVHLSDTHITSDTDTLFTRIELIAKAIRSMSTDATVCVVIFSGDITQSGEDDQYAAALDMVTALRELLGATFSDGLHFVAVPGNHDCYLQQALGARSALIGTLVDSDCTGVDQSTIDVCSQVQSSFFTFRDLVCPSPNPGHTALYWEHDITVGATTITIRCYNSAWVSQLDEQQGRIVLPTEGLPDSTGDSTVAVSVIHHPHNWFRSGNGRLVKDHLERTSDIILTGHEHIQGARLQRTSAGADNQYIEGAALQDRSRPDESGFNLILLDLERRHQQLAYFRWNGELYAQATQPLLWTEYQVNRLRRRRLFQPVEQLQKLLDDPGVALSHPKKGPLKLSDIFVYPDLKEMTHRPGEQAHAMRGEDILDRLEDIQRLLITGVEKSGKTCLAKRLFVDGIAKGKVPVLLDASNLTVSQAGHIVTAIEAAIEQQYGPGQLDRYRQLDVGERLIIIDNYHRLRTKRLPISAILRELTQHSRLVVIVGSDVVLQLADLVGRAPLSEGRKAFTHYRLAPFGHKRRNELAEKWFAMDPVTADDPATFSRKVIEVKRMTDIAIGRNYLPSYPVFVLPILQAHEHNENVDINASAYGYFYELLIKRALAEGSTGESFDVKLAYLAWLAYQLFKDGKRRASDSDLRAIHAGYEQHHLIELAYAHMLSDLMRCGILVEQEPGIYEFKYRYIAYFFLASYLRDHISEETTRSDIARLASQLYDEESANTLLFLAHLSKHPFIIQSVLAISKSVFPTASIADLARDSSPLSNMEQTLLELSYEDTDAADSRREAMERLDAADHSRVDVASTADGDGDDFLRQVGIAFKTLQILGQFLKNFPGSISGNEKQQLAEECYELGLRTLGTFYDIVREHNAAVAQTMIDILRAEDPDLPPEQLVERARASVFGLTSLASLGIVKRISYAIGSPHLTKVYDLIESRRPTPAVALVNTSIRLDQQMRFPTDTVEALHEALAGNAIAAVVLRGLVIGHFHLFDVPFDVKQRVCAKLGIRYKSLLRINPAVKLIGSGG